jgi:hypothetical protein
VRLGLARVEAVSVGDLRVELNGAPEYIELAFKDRSWTIVSGSPEAVRNVSDATGRPWLQRVDGFLNGPE